MKSTLYNIKTTGKNYNESRCEIDQQYNCKITIPNLDAYAVEYFTVQINGLAVNDDYLLPQTSKCIEFTSKNSLLSHDVKLIIHYHGIRNYANLFPWINDEELKERIGHYYRELELSFSNHSWLTFSLMSGALFEGLLYAKLNKPKKQVKRKGKYIDTDKTFNELIIQAGIQNLISNEMRKIMNEVRSIRNLVHANKYKMNYVNREKAYDIMSLIDNIIKEFQQQSFCTIIDYINIEFNAR